MEVALIEKEVNDALTIASKIIVTTNEEETFAVEFCKIIKNAQKQVGEEFDADVEDAHALHKKLVAHRAKYLKPLEDAEKKVKDLIKNFRLELEKKRQEEQRKQKEILDAEIKEMQDRLLKEAEDANKNGDTEKADKLAVQATNIEAGGVAVASKTVKQEGMSSRLIWKGRVTCKEMLPERFLIITVNQKAIDDFAKVNDNKVAVDGIEWYQDINLSVRA